MIFEGMKRFRVIASDKTWIDSQAVLQLEQTLELEGMRYVVGLPDLHPGKGSPIGASFISEGYLYPHLVGNDIGCGMGLWKTDLKTKKIKLDRWTKQLKGLEGPWDGDSSAWLENGGGVTTDFDASLGTIGGGNHFAELQKVEKVLSTEIFEQLGLEKNTLVLLVHSGSRGLGESILRMHLEDHQYEGLKAASKEGMNYLNRHDEAMGWAGVNRSLIAHRFLSELRTDGQKIVDVCHNWVKPITDGDQSFWLHRKGAAPSDEGCLVIPGSRGSFSYLVSPKGNQESNAFSLAHGAGRKWKRSDCRARLSSKYNVEALQQTDVGSRVICEDKNLIYEEAPQAYKDIDRVVQDLVDEGLLDIVAIFRPLITYKTRRDK